MKKLFSLTLVYLFAAPSVDATSFDVLDDDNSGLRSRFHSGQYSRTQKRTALDEVGDNFSKEENRYLEHCLATGVACNIEIFNKALRYLKKGCPDFDTLFT